MAEDDHDLRIALTQFLRSHGYRVDSVANGAALLDRLSEFLLSGGKAPADVIVTDVRMPGFSGLSIVEGLRMNGWSQPLVVISAFGDREMHQRVARLGRAAMIDKPFDGDELREKIEELLAS
ncbi:MAG TPA: response regulator [Kofleriaceae bacterium]|nr:response regulator [Kofleriaceae bacterium]